MLRFLPYVLVLATLAGCGVRHTTEPPPPFVPYRAPAASTTAPVPQSDAITTPAVQSTAPSPEAQPPTATDRAVANALESINKLLDAYFDFNAYRLRPDAVSAVLQSSAILKQLMSADTDIRLVIEGHCDERGSSEFNLALGDRRADSVRELLVELGLDKSRMTTISYGEVRPECADPTEECWQKNRRAHIRHER